MKKIISIIILLCFVAAFTAYADEATEYHDVTLVMNNGDEDQVLQVKDNGRIQQPEVPENEGNILIGWYTDEECTEKFIFSTKIDSDITLYAKWLPVFIFEAEDLLMDDMSGPGYSGAAYDYSMRVKDRYEAGASNEYYISYLYARYDNSAYNTTCEFHVDSTADVEDVHLILRLSAEYEDITINGDDFEVIVNDAKIGYDDITFEGAADATNNNSLLPFEDYEISANVTLQEGENVILLRTANDRKQGSGGTMNSTAPVVDCLKLAAEGTELSWTDGWMGEE